MLRFRRILIDNFGPFKGEQQIEFPQEDGISIFYGQNMRGKTMFLNAIRFALFGKVLTRNLSEIPLHRIGNWESENEGQYGFKVVLEFEKEDDEYELTRSCIPISGENAPTSDDDYGIDWTLEKNGTTLGPAKKSAELAKVMPEEISRFFLFDGELLSQYEKLVMDNEDDDGAEISNAIEKILGLPILTGARRDCQECYQRSQVEESKAAQRDHRTTIIGNNLEDLVKQRAHHDGEATRLIREKEEQETTAKTLEEELKRYERSSTLWHERDRLIARTSEKTERKQEKEAELKILMNEAWIGLIAEDIKRAKDAISQQYRSRLDAEIERGVNARVSEMRSNAISDGRCPICGSEVDNETRLKDLEDQEPVDSGNGSDITSTHHMKLARKLEFLEDLDLTEIEGQVIQILENIDSLRIDIANDEERIDEIAKETEDLDEKDIRRKAQEHDKALKKIAIIERGIDGEQERLGGIKRSVEKIQDELNRIGGDVGEELARSRAKRELLRNLNALFDAGISLYRDRLRARVENDASELFKNLTTEPEYAGLRINENYGLGIIHKDGAEISIRSAGAEQIVALSLIGALHRNAPLRGPIIMDSTFGRLDDEHSTNVLRSLPELTNQVVLLVYKRELEPEFARKELKGKLRAEYKFTRISARHTAVEMMME